MPLRGIRHHLETLELKTVTIVCSDKSIFQVNLFLDICKKYDQLKDITLYVLAKKANRIVLARMYPTTTIDFLQGFDFENLNGLSHAMRTLLREFKREKFHDKDIMIDFTGGQKVTSILAISMTVNREIMAQYVQTNEPWSVLNYSVRHVPSDTNFTNFP